MAISYKDALLALDAENERNERWLRNHADRTCGECRECEACPCGCEYGICHECNEMVGLEDKVGDYERYCWREK